eukprot:6787562-Lingulodinium_polyedra.AAC.1
MFCCAIFVLIRYHCHGLLPDGMICYVAILAAPPLSLSSSPPPPVPSQPPPPPTAINHQPFAINHQPSTAGLPSPPP